MQQGQARLAANAQVIIALDVEDPSNAEFWKDFNPEAWATAEAAGMKNITQCAALSRFAGADRMCAYLCTLCSITIAFDIPSAGAGRSRGCQPQCGPMAALAQLQ